MPANRLRSSLLLLLFMGERAYSVQPSKEKGRTLGNPERVPMPSRDGAPPASWRAPHATNSHSGRGGPKVRRRTWPWCRCCSPATRA
jgi:hypothetical protein